MTPLLLTRAEAAESLRMSLRHFERHAQPHLRIVRSGGLRLVPVSELERFVVERMDRCDSRLDAEATLV